MNFRSPAAVVAVIFLAGCGGGDSAAPLPVSTSTPTPTPTPTPVGKPNVIFIVADDFNDFTVGLGGHPQAYTPNLDRLAARGISFTNAHANATICAPSRPSFLSGYSPSTSNKYQSHRPFRDHPVLANAKLIPEHFRDNDYATYLAGKVFHDTDNDNTTFGTSDPATQPKDANDRSGGYIGPKQSFGPYPWDGMTKRNNIPYRLIPFGEEGVDWVRRSWGEIQLLSGGRWNSNPELPLQIQLWPYGFGRTSTPPTFQAGMNSTYPAGYSYSGFADADGEFLDDGNGNRSLLNDEKIANWASDLIRGQSPRDPSFADTKPLAGRSFMMMLGLTKTHAALYMPDEFFDKVIEVNNIKSIDDVILPPALPNDLADIPGDAKIGDGFLSYRYISEGGRSAAQIPDVVNKGQTISSSETRLLKSMVLSYLSAVFAVDVQVGKILDALDANPALRDNTIIIFTSDNGFHYGEKSTWGKGTLWSESTRIPLIIYDPRRSADASRGFRTNLPVSLVDLYPSLLELSGLPAPSSVTQDLQLDGTSLAPIIRNPKSPDFPRRPIAISSNFGLTSDKDPADPSRRNHSIRTEGWRYTLARDGGEELYNEETDPNEWNNLANDPAFRWVKDLLKPILLERTGQTQ